MNSFQEHVLMTAKGKFSLENKILKIITIESGVVVLFDNSNFDENHPRSNLCLFSENGEKKWEAELSKELRHKMPYSSYEPEPYDYLGDPNGDTYLKKDEIAAGSVNWYCILDTTTGKIKERHVNK